MLSTLLAQLLFYLSLVDATNAFVVQSPLTSSSFFKDSHCHQNSYREPKLAIDGRRTASSNSRCYNFLKDAFDSAFSNDRTLAKDKRRGQYDDIYTGEEYIESNPDDDDGLTDVQRKWRQSQTTGPTSSKIVIPDMIVGKSLTMDLYLSGIPERDPSNDLYGSKVNISSRDKATGLSLPSAPSVNVQLDFLDNGVCQCSETGFTTGETNGEWKLSEDGKVLRFSMDAVGYTRTVQTKGSISKVYWTDEEEKSVKTSTTYSIPAGMVYGDIQVIRGRKPGSFDVEKEGALRAEKKTGLFGVGNQLVACGKFVAALKKDQTVV